MRQEGVLPAFERLFPEYGLPEAIRADNGAPSATQAVCGLSKPSAWWIKRGIAHQRVEPGRPPQNGRHERMHRTLKRETAGPPEKDHPAQHLRFDAWRDGFNAERPREAPGHKTPAPLYGASLRPLPLRLPEPDYAGRFRVRLVSSKPGVFRLHHRRPIFISEALIGAYVGLEEADDGVSSLYLYDVLLGRLDERDYEVRG